METGDRPRILILAADGLGEYNQFTGTRFKELEKHARALGAREKAALARVRIEDLDPSVDPNVEQLWIEEAQRRHDAFTAGKLKALPGEEVMRRVPIGKDRGLAQHRRRFRRCSSATRQTDAKEGADPLASMRMVELRR